MRKSLGAATDAKSVKQKKIMDMREKNEVK